MRASVASLRTALAARETDLANATRQLTEAAEQHHTSVTEVSQKSARLEVLRQFFAASDGRATLGSILEVEPQYGAAIEAALNHAIHTILADDLDAARALLASGLKNPVRCRRQS